MNFVPFNAHTTSLFKNCNILKFADIINVGMSSHFLNFIFKTSQYHQTKALNERIS